MKPRQDVWGTVKGLAGLVMQYIVCWRAPDADVLQALLDGQPRQVSCITSEDVVALQLLS